MAFTRAADHLVVSMHHKDRSCVAGRLLEAVTADRALAGASVPAPQAPVVQAPPARHPSPTGDLGEPTELERAEQQTRRIWTPSAIAKVLGDAAGPAADVSLVQGSLFVDGDEADEVSDDVVTPGERFGAMVGRRPADADDHEATDPGNRKEPGPNDRPSRRGGRFGTAKGSAVHAVMQQVALADPRAGLSTLVDVAAEAEGVLDRRDDIESMVDSLLAGGLFVRMQASPRCRREMYVGSHFGPTDGQGITVWGYVDAVFANPDGTLTLVDFKTDTFVTSAAELALRYQPQMSAYVAALEQATGSRVSEAWLAVARADGSPALEIPVTVIPVTDLLSSLTPLIHAGRDQISRQLT